jgi:predicted nucleic acid-binding protein
VNIFLDTSSLLKLYHFEDGTSQLINLLQSGTDNHIFLSEVALVEIYSAIYKKVRTGELDDNKATPFLELFQQDIDQFTIIPLNSQLVKKAQQLLISYGSKGLRTLDSLQLASVVITKNTISLAITHDDLLKTFLISENINTQF